MGVAWGVMIEAVIGFILFAALFAYALYCPMRTRRDMAAFWIAVLGMHVSVALVIITGAYMGVLSSIGEGVR